MTNLALVPIGEEFFGDTHPLMNLEGVGSLVSLILNIAFVVAGVSLLVFFIVAGIGMISSAGQNNPEKLEKSKQAVTSALIGFIVVFTAYWIVKLIGEVTGFKKIL